MKKLYFKSTGTVFKLCIVLLITCVAIIYSCKKDTPHSSPPLNQKEQSTFVQEAKSWFERNEAINKEQPLATNATGTDKRKWNDALKPDWNKTAVYQKDKGTIIEMPLFSSAVSFLMNTTDGSRATLQNNYTRATYLIQKDSVGVFKGWYMVLIADTSYINGDFGKLNKNSFQSKDPAYSGRLLYFDLQGKFLGGWRYINGEITKTITLSDYTTTNQQVTDSKIKVNLVQNCHSIPITTVTWECITVGDNPETASTTCTAHYTYTTETECTPAGGGGSGGGGSGGGGGSSGGGGGNFPNPPKPDCPPGPVVNPSSIDGQRVNLIDDPCNPKPANDPCAEKNKVKNTASNPAIAQKNQTILNNTVSSGTEYGSDIKLSNINNSSNYVNTPVTTNGQTSAFTPNFTWNNVDGFSVGASHGHPGGTAPSPADAVWAYGNITNPDLISSGNLQFYKDNVSVTTNTVNGTYVITVKDWTALQALYNSFHSNPASFNANYVQIAQQNNFSAEYALLSMFGNALNVYKAQPGSTDFKPLIIDNNNTVNVQPCPQ